MLSAEEIRSANAERANAIFDRFEAIKEPTNDLAKSEDANEAKDLFFTEENLNAFKNDLFKGIDEGTVSEDDLEKAQEDLLSLTKETRVIEGKETTVFVKG